MSQTKASRVGYIFMCGVFRWWTVWGMAHPWLGIGDLGFLQGLTEEWKSKKLYIPAIRMETIKKTRTGVECVYSTPSNQAA